MPKNVARDEESAGHLRTHGYKIPLPAATMGHWGRALAGPARASGPLER